MELKRIQEKAADWFEWHGLDHSTVTTVSACIFAAEIAKEVEADMREKLAFAEGRLATLDSIRRERDALREAIRLTLEENGHLPDGDVCTLIRLKTALQPNT